MIALDTNLLVRLITDDDPAQADQVRRALDAAMAEGEVLLVSNIALVELVWVLGAGYGYAKEQQMQVVEALLMFRGLSFEVRKHVVLALKAWREGEGDFADSLMGASMRAAGCDYVLTLDKKAARAATHRLLQPTQRATR